MTVFYQGDENMNINGKEKLRTQTGTILRSQELCLDEKLCRLNQLHSELELQEAQEEATVDIAIEELFVDELRRLNAIRERNMASVDSSEIRELKMGFNHLFRAIEGTLDWAPEKKSSLEGVINRATLRAMLVDPAVPVDTKEELMDKWDDFL